MHRMHIGLVGVLLLAAHAASATPCATLPSGASIIRVRVECGTDASCCEDMSDALDWVWGTRVPTASDHLLIDVGPGVFESFDCPNDDPRNGYVTVRGAGRESTVLGGPGAGIGGTADACEDLEFVDLRFEGEAMGFGWINGGNGTFTGVDIAGRGGTLSLGFVGQCPLTMGASDQMLVRFFGSRITSHGNNGIGPAAAVIAECTEAWLYGGELLWMLEEGGSIYHVPHRSATVSLGAAGSFHAFGTVIRTIAKDLAAPVTVPIHGVAVSTNTLISTSEYAGDPSAFELHGGIVSMTVEDGQSTSDTIGLVVDGSGATADTADSAFFIEAPQGKKRVASLNGGLAEAAFLWQSGTTPPTASTEANEVTSVDGLDLFVETDCESNGDCTSGDETHLMVYNASACPASDPWFDIVTGRCRGVVSP